MQPTTSRPIIASKIPRGSAERAGAEPPCDLKRYAKNLNHITLPEIKDFNALCDARCLRYFVKRYNNRKTQSGLVTKCHNLRREILAAFLKTVILVKACRSRGQKDCVAGFCITRSRTHRRLHRRANLMRQIAKL